MTTQTYPAYIVAGQRWTFVHTNGKRTEYLIETAEDAMGLADVCKIVNTANGGIGWVTKHWLRAKPGDIRGHFEFVAEAGEAMAA